MIPEIGHFALILALGMAVIQTLFPLAGAQLRYQGWIHVAKPAARLQAFFLVISFAALVWAFLANDFSVLYVATNSNTKLPTLYKISAVWGAHEGSLLLWALILAVWGMMVSIFSRSIPEVMTARVLGILGLVSIGFLLFMLLTSNPFDRIPAPAEGRDLNPLLQDFGLAVHPPMLYMGYVGLVVPFAFAIAAMLGGHLDAAWARWSRPWTNVAWMFLTLGIALGSWWAYYELGWGGWWFWDPVENASFMPWLVATALIHSLAVTEKRGAFKAWTVLLAIFAFSLSLLGTFLVRSGVLTSVHAFASDPERGVFILAFLALVVGGSLTLFAMRGKQIRSFVHFSLLSRESGLLLNNILLVVITLVVLMGTVYPILHNAAGWGNLSVGKPYFDLFFAILSVPLVLALGVGALLRWKRDDGASLVRKLVPALIASVIGGVLVMLYFGFSLGAILGVALAVWVTWLSVVALRDQLKGKRKLSSVPRGFWGMLLGHLGVAVFTIGVTLTSIYSVEKDVGLGAGDSYELAGYTFTFNDIKSIEGPNYRGTRGIVTASNEDYTVTLYPEKRTYFSSAMPMTEAGIDAGLTRDLFVALGEPLGNGQWAVRLYHKPFIRWIWLGCLIMGIGGLLAATDRRYLRMARRSRSAAAVSAQGATA
ncbi:MAG: heme lyase CcmF/NrfE family subunit [Gammaproteobacteria bacterium]|jgi:cytochrome c-type biogenesis protein CcmF